MSTRSLVALGLTVLGIGCVLYAAVLGGFPLLAGPEATLEMLGWMDRVLGSEPVPLLESLIEDPVGFVLLDLAVTAIPLAPGLACLTAGFVVWRRFGLPALHLAEEDAAREPEREKALQWLIRERLERVLDGEAEGRTGLEGEHARALGALDTLRRHRFELFLHESSLDPRAPGHSSGPPRAAAASTSPRPLLGQVLAVLLAGASVFAFLWGILSAFSVGLMQDLLDFPEGSHAIVLALLVSWAGALTLLAAAVGVHRLARWDRRIEERRCEGLAAAAERALTGYGECLRRLRTSQATEDETRDACIARGLTLSGLRGLDDEGRKRLLRVGHERGVDAAGIGPIEE